MKRYLLFLTAICCAGIFHAQTHLPDGAVINIGDEYLEENIVRPGDLTDLLEGTISYDPVNHVLTLTDVLIETSKQVALGMTCSNMEEGSKQIEVRVVGSNIVRTTFSSGYALFLGEGSFVITGMNGSLKLMSNDGFGLYDWADELTIKDGVWVYAGYSETGCQSAYGATGSGVMNINCAKFHAYGTDVTMYGLNPSLTRAVEKDGYAYNSSSDQWTEDGTNVLKNKTISFEPTEHDHIFAWINANPEGGTITVTKDGNPLPNPYYYGQDEESTRVDILATPNEGWEFVAWRAFNGAFWDANMAETTYGLPELVTTGTIIGFFRQTQHPAPSKPWYLLSEYYEKIVSIDDWSKSPAVVSENFLSDMSVTKLKFATFAEGRLYFIDQEDTDKSGLYSVQFDPNTGKMSDPQMHFNAQDTYQKFYCLTYDYTDGFLYGIALKSDNEQYLVKINLKTNLPSAVGRVENTSVMNSRGVWMMTATPEGQLYGIFKVGETHNKENSPFRHGSMLCKIDKTNAAITPVGWTGEYFEVSSLSMACDYKTGELIATTSSTISSIVSIDKKTGKATPLQGYTSYCNGLFQLVPTLKPVTVGVKSGQEGMGTAVLLETGKTEGKYMEGDEYDIEAFPKTSDYRFVQWNDGVTDNPRTITMGTDASYTWTAEFDYAEGAEPTPVYIGSRRLTSLTGTLTNELLSEIKSGSLSYDPQTRILTLSNLNLEVTSDEPAISIVGETDEPVGVTILLNGVNQIKAQPDNTGALSFSDANVKITGERLNVSVTAGAQPGVLLERANLTIDGCTANIAGNGGALMAMTETEVLTARGSYVEFNSSVTGLDSIELQYSSLTTPEGAAYDKMNRWVGKDGSMVSGTIVIEPWPALRVAEYEEGTGSFIIKSETDEFKNVGWFEAGTSVTITAVPADGFEFVRWKEDPNWGDEEKTDEWWTETIEVTTEATDLNYTALFYYTPKSEKTWYAVHNDQFISFEMSERAAHAQIASEPSASGLMAGDYRDDYLDFQEATYIKGMPFDDVTDKEPLSGKDDVEEWAADVSVSMTDMSYDLSRDEMYGVADGKLYRINYGDQKVEEVGVFKDEDENTVSAISIAINADGAMYILASGAPGRLYSVSEMDEENSLVKVAPVGEDEGDVGMSVSAVNQSIAFDHVTGELFWGAPDYLRKFNLETAQSYACGDLNYKKGLQGEMKALHCKSHFVKVNVKIDGDDKDAGTVKVNSVGYGAGKFLAGQKATITAQANEGYTFLYWQKKGSSKEIDKSTYSFAVNSTCTYIAYFKKNTKPEEGMDEVQSDDVQGTKVLVDGTLYILRDGHMYDALGNCVK